jgi:ribosomal protein S18 acetylase RimI-like enzyme
MIDTDWPGVRETLQIYLYPERYSHLPETNHVTIRSSQLDDLLHIAELEKNVSGQGYTFSTIRQHYDLFSNLLYVAETKDARVVGYVLGGIATCESQVGRILSIGVRRDYRGKGIGKRLMAAIQTQLHSRNCRKILLTVHPHMDHVVRFYEKIGYTKQQLWPDYFGPDAPRYVMQLLYTETNG